MLNLAHAQILIQRLLASITVAFSSLMNGIEQILMPNGLVKNHSYHLHRLHGHWDVAMSSDENDGNLNVGPVSSQRVGFGFMAVPIYGNGYATVQTQ